MNKFFRFVNTLSLDIVIGALASGYFVTKLLDVELGFVWWIVLALSVWIIYTLDHLIDAYRLKNEAHTLRHKFHFQYRKEIIVTVFFTTIVNAVLVILLLDRAIIIFGLTLSVYTGLYLLMIFLWGNKNFALMQKELFVGLIYAVGIWGGPMAVLKYQLTHLEVGFFISFFFLVLSDILVLSHYEVNSDDIDMHSNFVLRHGLRTYKVILYALLGFVFCFSVLVNFLLGEMVIYSTIYILMIVSMWILVWLKPLLERNYVYRWIIEMIFWLPGIALFI